MGLKTTISTTSQLNGKFGVNISGKEHDIGNQEKSVGNIERSPTSSKNFMNFGLLTLKIEPEFSPTLRNHHLLGGDGHHVGMPLGVPSQHF